MRSLTTRRLWRGFTSMLALSSTLLLSAHCPVLPTVAVPIPLLPPPPSFVDLYQEGYNPRIVWRSNDGQVIDTDGDLRPDVIAKSEGLPITIWARTNSTLTYSWLSTSDPMAGPDAIHRIDMRPVGELAEDIIPNLRSVVPGHTNYYYPHTAPDGVEGVEAYNEVFYGGIYPGIDLIIYSGSGGPKMAYVCNVGSDPTNILLQMHGQDSLRIDGLSEELAMYKNGSAVRIPKAIAYQTDGTDVNLLGWEATYVQQSDSDMISFNVETYDPAQTLVFLMGAPPQAGGGGGPNGNMDWNTTVGRDAGIASDFTWGSDVGSDGSLYTAGHTNDPLYPANPGSIPIVANTDVVVSHFKYNPSGPDDAVNDWTTFVGGTDYDKAQALHVAANGDVYAVGWTNSPDFRTQPLLDPGDGSYWEDQLKGDHDGVIMKLEPATGILERSSTFGGDDDDILTAITEDADGNIYIGGNTVSSLG